VPPGLTKYYEQAPAWERCDRYADDQVSQSLFADNSLECARVSVPLDYAQPTGKPVLIGLLRKKAKGTRIGSLLLNPGGPGESGMVAAAGIAADGWKGALAEKFDLVGFDPRGVGASEPKVQCLSDKEKDAEREEPPIRGADAVPRIEKKNQDLAGKCAAATGKDLLANIGTRDVVRDMDVLRSVLGDEKLSYLGYSYGTRIGTAYAEAFPGNVRAMVLDGAVDPNADRVTQIVGQANGFKKAFADFAAWCAKRATCAVGTAPAAAEDKLDKLLDPLKQQPVVVAGRKLSYSDATTAVIQGLYSEQLWEPLATGLDRLARGDGEVLLKLSDFYQGRDQNGGYSTTEDAFMAIRCVDDPPVKDRAVVADEARRIAEAVPDNALDDDDEVPALSPCAFWPVPNTGAPHEPKTPGLPKVLVISTTNDPATPYQAGVNLAKALGAGLLTVEGTRHTAFLQNSQCADDAGAAYLIELRQPADGTRC
jgi:pimeloyl-ACP methyl ester carboxylesterase